MPKAWAVPSPRNASDWPNVEVWPEVSDAGQWIEWGNCWLVFRLTEGFWNEVWLAAEEKQQVPKDLRKAEEFKDEPLRSSMTTQRFFSQSLGSSQGAGGEKWEEWASIYRGGAQKLKE